MRCIFEQNFDPWSKIFLEIWSQNFLRNLIPDTKIFLEIWSQISKCLVIPYLSVDSPDLDPQAKKIDPWSQNIADRLIPCYATTMKSRKKCFLRVAYSPAHFYPPFYPPLCLNRIKYGKLVNDELFSRDFLNVNTIYLVKYPIEFNGQSIKQQSFFVQYHSCVRITTKNIVILNWTTFLLHIDGFSTVSATFIMCLTSRLTSLSRSHDNCSVCFLLPMVNFHLSQDFLDVISLDVYVFFFYFVRISSANVTWDYALHLNSFHLEVKKDPASKTRRFVLCFFVSFLITFSQFPLNRETATVTFHRSHYNNISCLVVLTSIQYKRLNSCFMTGSLHYSKI